MRRLYLAEHASALLPGRCRAPSQAQGPSHCLLLLELPQALITSVFYEVTQGPRTSFQIMRISNLATLHDFPGRWLSSRGAILRLSIMLWSYGFVAEV